MKATRLKSCMVVLFIKNQQPNYQREKEMELHKHTHTTRHIVILKSKAHVVN